MTLPSQRPWTRDDAAMCIPSRCQRYLPVVPFIVEVVIKEPPSLSYILRLSDVVVTALICVGWFGGSFIFPVYCRTRVSDIFLRVLAGMEKKGEGVEMSKDGTDHVA